MNDELLKVANDNLCNANKMLENKINELSNTINELRESVINWDIDWCGLTPDEDYQRLQELKDILDVKEDKKIEKIDLSEWSEITYSEDWEMLTKDFNRNCTLFVNKINEIIDKLNEMGKE